MDIALKLKRAVATLAAGALFVSSAGVAIAQTFNDVPTDAWYYDYVEQLVDDGVIDVADNYRPADALNRAELVKIAITAIDGLAGYEAPATPTFDDVPADAWFFDYVEAAVQLGIVNGYTDASGNLTGYFGPGDTVNRAAATKILVNAFSVPTDLDPGSVFPDVKSGDWFHDYVITAYNQSVLDGYDNGYFGPADAVTRAQVAKLVVNSQNPVERAVSGEGEGEGEGVGESEGDIEVSLNDDTAASSTLPLSANGVALASFDVTADQDDVYVSQLVVTRGGVGQADDWANLYLYDGAQRLTTGRTVNNDTNTATFPLKLTVEAGTTTTLTLVGDVSATALGSNQHYFYIASAANVTSNAQSVSGDFPVAGNTFTMGSVSVNTVTTAPGTAPSKVTIGAADAEIASVKLTAGAQNDIALHQLALTNGGSLSSEKLVNLRLLRGTDEVATADGFVGDVVTFVLDTPYVIDEGQTKTFYVNADIDGGRSSDTIILYLDEDTDVIAVDQQYGFGAAVTNNFTQALANIVALEGGDVTVVDNGPAASQIAQNATNIELLNFSMTAARDLTVRDTFIQIDIQDQASGTGPDVTTIGTDTAAITGAAINTAGNFCVVDDTGFVVGDMLQIATAAGTEYAIISAIDLNNSGAGAPCAAGTDDEITTNSTTGSTIANGAAINEVNPYDYVKNVKLVDLDSGSTLAGPMTDANAGATLVEGGAGVPDSYNKVHSEDYELTGSDTSHLSVQADLDQNMASGYQVRAQVRYSDGVSASSYIKDLAANEFVTTSNVIGAGATALAGDFMITASNSLAVSKAATPTSQSYVKGDTNVPTIGIALAAGDAGDILLKRLSVRIYADDDGVMDDIGATTPSGDIAADTLVSSITLYDGNDVVAGPESLNLVDTGAAGFVAETGDYYRAQFDDLDIMIDAGATKTLTAKVNLLNTATAQMYLALDVNPSADIIAEDDDANTIVASGGQLNYASAPNPLITILTSGGLQAYAEGNPDADILVAGASEQLVAKYRFRANDEDFQVKKLTIANDNAATNAVFGNDLDTGPAVASITLKYPDVNGVTQTKTNPLSGGTAKFAGMDFYVPAGEDAFLEVYANVNTAAAVGEALSGQSFRLGIQNINNDITTFEAIGQSSSTNLNFGDTGGALGETTKISNYTDISTFVVRKTVPTFANVSASESLANGIKTLMSFSVTADSAGPVSFGRIVLNVDQADSDDASLNTANYQLYRGSSLLSTVNIYDSVGDLSAASLGGAAADQNEDVIVSFNSEESVNAGSSQTYSLKALVSGADSDDSVTTTIVTGDEATPVAGILGTAVCGNANDKPCSTGNANTGQIYETAANEALFTASATEFSDTNTANRNIIWSDKSAKNHAYPAITAGTVTAPVSASDWNASNEGPYDWTNGYLLDITELEPHTLSKN
ncbi:S-layer homology domain-containing protein [Candidatus Peregrinibacteria bacterium]|nr:S-layer homology domain-containing protein [Candidatus Peregrinibacteria bacterium]